LYYTTSGIITLKQVSGLKITKIIKITKIQLYFSNFSYFSKFRPLTCFSVMIPEAAQYSFDLLTMST